MEKRKIKIETKISGKSIPQKIPLYKLNPKELKASAKIVDEQADRLSLLDPLDNEPALIFMAQGDRK